MRQGSLQHASLQRRNLPQRVSQVQIRGSGDVTPCVAETEALEQSKSVEFGVQESIALRVKINLKACFPGSKRNQQALSKGV